MPERRRKYTAEFKNETAKIVVETSRPIAEVVREIHVNPGTFGHWVAKYRVDPSSPGSLGAAVSGSAPLDAFGKHVTSEEMARRTLCPVSRPLVTAAVAGHLCFRAATPTPSG